MCVRTSLGRFTAAPALIDVPVGTERALQDESDGEQQRDTLNTEMPPRPSGFRQFLRLQEGREEENRARTGTQRVITPRKGKC